MAQYFLIPDRLRACRLPGYCEIFQRSSMILLEKVQTYLLPYLKKLLYKWHIKML